MANMSKTPRLYKVTAEGAAPRLISGHNQAQIARYIASDYTIETASAMEAAELAAQGIKVESATASKEV